MDEPQAARSTAETARHGSRREVRENREGSRTERRDRDKEREELRLVPPPRKNEKNAISPRGSQKSGASRKHAHRSEKRRSWNASDHTAHHHRKERGPKVRKVAPEDVPSITAPERRGYLGELIGGQWERRFYVLKDGHFRTYKSQEDMTEESDMRMRSAQLKEFLGEPERHLCFALNGRVFRAEDDYDLVEWVFAVTGAMQYYAIMQKVNDAINSKAIDKRTVLQKMPSLRLAVDDQILSPRSARSARTSSGLSLNASVAAPAPASADATDPNALTPRGTRRVADVHPAAAERLTPRGSRREEAQPQAHPEAPVRTDSQVPPAPPSSAHITRPEGAPMATSSDGSDPLSPRALKKQHKAQEKVKRAGEKAEGKAKRAEEKAEEKAKRAEEKAKRQEEKAEERRVEAERKAKKEEEKREMRKSKAMQRQNSAPNLRAAAAASPSPAVEAPSKAALAGQHKFSTVALGRGAALLPVEASEPIVVTTTPAMPMSSKPEGKHKHGHVMVLKKALTIPNWRKRYLSYANGSLSIHKKETLPASISLNMLFCSCKLGAKGRNGRVYVFEVVSPRKTYFIAVNTAGDLRDWVELLQGAQAELMTQTLYASMAQLPTENKETQSAADRDRDEARRMLKELRENPENSVCADCNAEDPAWVSLNLGVFLCIECGGVHRKLGTHISQLRSVSLDHLKLEQVQALKALGTNQQLNRRLYEAVPSPLIKKPSPDATAEEREVYIKHKYVTKTFHPPAAAAGASAP